MKSLDVSRRNIIAGVASCALWPKISWADERGRLKDRAAQKDILIGSAVDFIPEPVDPSFLELLTQECNSIVPENAGKWKWIEPEPGKLSWQAMDRTVEFAKQIGAKINWHVGLWQNGGMPEFMKLSSGERTDFEPRLDPYYSDRGTLTPENYWQRFTAFIDGVAARYGDIFYRIDAANEMFLGSEAGTNSNLRDAVGMRKGMWWMVAGGANGPDWLDPFFHYQRRAFPSARLVINEFGIEADERNQKDKRAALRQWIENAVTRGCPVDGVGLQSHLVADKKYDTQGMAEFCKAVKDLGLDIYITEMDVDGSKLLPTMTPEKIDHAVADYANLHVQTLAQHGQLKEITWWGMRSDLNYTAKRHKAIGVLQPSLFKSDNTPLPLYNSLLKTLEMVS